MIKQRLFIPLFSFTLVACESSNNGGQLEDLADEATAPTVIAFAPDTEEDERIEPDTTPRITFSEKINLDSVIKDGVELRFVDVAFSDSPLSDDNAPLLFNEQLAPTFEETLVRSEDPQTGLDVDVVATIASIQTRDRQLSLGASYELQINTSVKDRSGIASINPVTNESTTGNFLERTESRFYATSDGSWASSTLLPVGLSRDVAIVKSASNPVNKHSTYWTEPTNDTPASFKVISFDTASARWHHPLNRSLINTPLTLTPPANTQGDFTKPSAAFGTESVLATWLQLESGSGNQRLYLSYFSGASANEVAFSPPLATATTNILDTQLLHRNDGRFGVAWVEQNGNNYRVMFAVYDPSLALGNRLSAGVEIKAASNPISNLTVTDNHHFGVLKWLANNNGVRQVNAALIDRALAVNTDSMFSTLLSHDALNVKAAISKNGDGYLTWQQHDNTRFNVWRSRIEARQFNAAELVEFDNTYDAITPAVAYCRNGLATFFWAVRQNNQLTIQSSMLDIQLNGWTQAQNRQAFSSPADVDIEASYDQACNLVAAWGGTGTNTTATYYSVLTKTWASNSPLTSQASSSSGLSLTPLDTRGRYAISMTERNASSNLLTPTTSLFSAN